MLKHLNKISEILIDILLFIIIALIFFSLYNIISIKVSKNKYSSIFGYTMFEVISGSMEPTISVKDFIIVKITDNIKVGDIITYTDGKDFITHRVIDINEDTIHTKGDANNSEDYEISRESLVGKVVLVLPKVGIIKEVLFTPKIVISLVTFLILFGLCFSYVPNKKRKSSQSLDNNFEEVNNVINKK